MIPKAHLNGKYLNINNKIYLKIVFVKQLWLFPKANELSCSNEWIACLVAPCNKANLASQPPKLHHLRQPQACHIIFWDEQIKFPKYSMSQSVPHFGCLELWQFKHGYIIKHSQREEGGVEWGWGWWGQNNSCIFQRLQCNWHCYCKSSLVLFPFQELMDSPH